MGSVWNMRTLINKSKDDYYLWLTVDRIILCILSSLRKRGEKNMWGPRSIGKVMTWVYLACNFHRYHISNVVLQWIINTDFMIKYNLV